MDTIHHHVLLERRRLFHPDLRNEVLRMNCYGKSINSIEREWSSITHTLLCMCNPAPEMEPGLTSPTENILFKRSPIVWLFMSLLHQHVSPLLHVSSTSTRVPSSSCLFYINTCPLFFMSLLHQHVSPLRDSESFRNKDSLSFCPDPFL